MTAEILIPVALGALLLTFVLSLLLRRRPKRSARLVSASLESAPKAADNDHIEPSAVTKSEEAPQAAIPRPAPAKPAEEAKTGTSIAAKPAPVEAGEFLPTLAPAPVAATSARASVPSQSAAPKFVVQSPLKSEAPSRKTKPVAVSPVAKRKPQSPDTLTPASDKVVDITTAISVRAPQKTKTLRSALPEKVRAALARLNQRFDRLEDAVLDLENQLEDFDLDFSQPGKPAGTIANAANDRPVETATDSEEADEVKSDRDEKTIAA